MNDQHLPRDVSGELLAIPPNRIAPGSDLPLPEDTMVAYFAALLAALYPSSIGPDPERPGWHLVTVELPTGRGSWQVEELDLDLFGHVFRRPAGAEQAAEPGHLTYDRIARLAIATAPIDHQLTGARVAERARIRAELEPMRVDVKTDTDTYPIVAWSAVELATE